MARQGSRRHPCQLLLRGPKTTTAPLPACWPLASCCLVCPPQPDMTFVASVLPRRQGRSGEMGVKVLSGLGTHTPHVDMAARLPCSGSVAAQGRVPWGGVPWILPQGHLGAQWVLFSLGSSMAGHTPWEISASQMPQAVLAAAALGWTQPPLVQLHRGDLPEPWRTERSLAATQILSFFFCSLQVFLPQEM